MVVYPHCFDRVLHIPTGCLGWISEPPTVIWFMFFQYKKYFFCFAAFSTTKFLGRLDPQEVAVEKGGISKVGLPGGVSGDMVARQRYV